MIELLITGGIGYMLYKLTEVYEMEYILMWDNAMEDKYEENIIHTNDLVSDTGVHLPFIRNGKQQTSTKKHI